MQTPYEPYNDKIGVRLSYVVAEDKNRRPIDSSLGLVGYSAYEKRALRNPGLKLRDGRGFGNEVLLCWEHLPHDWKEQLIKHYGDPKTQVQKSVLEKYYIRDMKAAEFFVRYIRPDEKKLTPSQIQEYTINACVLNAVIQAKAARKSWCKALGGSAKNVWPFLETQLEAIRETTGHTLKTASLRRTVANYQKEGFQALISRKLGNQNTAKIKTGENMALLEELLKKHNNLDNEQIKSLYNMAAERLNWKTISAGTVANYREELDLYTYSGRRGETNFRNTRSMQVKRRAPAHPLYYWTLDGWDAELLYQKTEINASGNTITTYHNRLTVVVVLDPCCKYPVGYAIGAHENADLIKEALRNATNHTKELFGNRYKPQQLQSDHYALKTLTPLYEAMSKHFTPARVKNAKAKVIEPYFKSINKKYCQLQQNWSGFGVTANKESQPNGDYLQKIRHQFPDEQGCRAQIVHLITMERQAKLAEYQAKWEAMPNGDRMSLNTEEYLNLFGETTGYTNRLEDKGLRPTIMGEKRAYDSYDVRFHELRQVDWAVKYDPSDLSNILVVNAEGRNGRLEKIIGDLQFILDAKYEQPMALIERQAGDAGELQRVRDFNKNLEETIIERGAQNRELLEDMFNANPQLEGTLTKLILTDSAGQHKDRRNVNRVLQNAETITIKQTRQIARQETNQEQAMRNAYLDSKLDYSEFLD